MAARSNTAMAHPGLSCTPAIRTGTCESYPSSRLYRAAIYTIQSFDLTYYTTLHAIVVLAGVVFNKRKVLAAKQRLAKENKFKAKQVSRHPLRIKGRACGLYLFQES